MTKKRWFLPDAPDLLGMLQMQTRTTIEGMDALVEWAEGDRDAGDRVRMLEHQADEEKRNLQRALGEAFTLPLEPEDLFTLSMALDDVLGGAKNTVREAEVMHIGPDRAMAEMAVALAAGTRELVTAFGALARHKSSEATDAADRVIKSQRGLEHVYRAAMSALVEVEDIRELAAKRELYRRMSRTSEQLIAVAERVWYAVLKLS
jgi:uncharacterized protein Yka (UPF0111/DUF47 family)